MRRLNHAVLLAMAIAALALHCSSVEQACDDYATAWCNRHYACYTGAGLTALQAMYGQTAQDCVTAFELQANCLEAQSTCPINTSYDTGAAERCVTTYAASSCEDISDPSVQIPGCSTSDICH